VWEIVSYFVTTVNLYSVYLYSSLGCGHKVRPFVRKYSGNRLTFLRTMTLHYFFWGHVS